MSGGVTRESGAHDQLERPLYEDKERVWSEI